MLLGSIGPGFAAITAAQLESLLNQNKMLVVAVKSVDNQDAFYGTFKTHLGLASLFEIVLYRKAPATAQSYVCCKSPRVNDTLPVLFHVLTLLAKSTSGTQTPAAQIVDNLFPF